LPPGHKPILCYVTDGRALEAATLASGLGGGNSGPALRLRLLRECIRRAAAAGVDWIQIREKDLDSRSLMEVARSAVAEARSTSTKIFINDRFDVALAAGAAGVHLGEQSLPPELVNEWRRAAGRSDFQVGASCHSLESARAAERAGADYVFFGPVFATPSKAGFGPPQGTLRLLEVSASVQIPVIAIGGVNAGNAGECIEATAAGIAAIRLFQDAKSSEEIAAIVTAL
jgi:thiamine-phosphate pyrophosphorylase